MTALCSMLYARIVLCKLPAGERFCSFGSGGLVQDTINIMLHY